MTEEKMTIVKKYKKAIDMYGKGEVEGADVFCDRCFEDNEKKCCSVDFVNANMEICKLIDDVYTQGLFTFVENVVCPECGHWVNIEDAVSRVESKLRGEYCY